MFVHALSVTTTVSVTISQRIIGLQSSGHLVPSVTWPRRCRFLSAQQLVPDVSHADWRYDFGVGGWWDSRA